MYHEDSYGLDSDVQIIQWWCLIALCTNGLIVERHRGVLMRVALMPSRYAPFVGGVEELTRNLGLALKNAGDQVEIWTSDPGRDRTPHSSIAEGLSVRTFDFALPARRASSMASFPGRAIGTMRALRMAVRSFRPDVVHVQCFGPNGPYATVLCDLFGLPLVVTLQGETIMDDHDIFDRSTTLRTSLRLALGRARAVTACSQFALDDALDRFGAARSQGSVIFNGVKLPNGPWAPKPAEGLSVSGASPRRSLLALGRLVEKKGFDLLIDAFSRIANRHPDVVLVIAGEGPSRKSLERQAAALGLEKRIWFSGHLDRCGVARAMAEAEVFVMPSRIEPFGIVVLEAWCAATPVIATNRGGTKEFIHDGVDGVLVDPTDIGEMAHALDVMVSSQARREKIGAAGHRRVGDFAWSVIAARYRSLYLEVTGSSFSERIAAPSLRRHFP